MKQRIILCISREYGSGGREVGTRLAKILGIPCYDKELLAKTAQAHGVSEAFIASCDEKPVSWSSLGFPMGIQNPYQAEFYEELYYVMNDRIFFMEAQTIRQLASEGSCIIVGRAAEEILKDDPDRISLFIHADKQERIRRIMALDQVDAQKAEQVMRRMDKKRASYHNYYSENKWGVCSSCDLSISTSTFGIDGTVQAILAVLNQLK